MRIVLAVVASVGCGRIWFDELRDAGADGRALLGDVPAGALAPIIGDCSEADLQGGTTDNYLDGTSKDRNHGVTDRMRVGEIDVAIVRFDLSSIPITATLLGVDLVISVSPNDALEQGHVEVFRLLEAWDEGVFNFGSGASSWNERSAGVPWSTPGAGPPGSRDTIVLGSFVPALESVRHVIALDPASLQTWIAAPATNHGVVLVARDTGGQGAWLSTNDEPDASRKPCVRPVYVP